MATKSTKFKFSNLNKALCLLLSVLLFSLGTWCAVELGIGGFTFGEDYFSGTEATKKQSYTETYLFERVLDKDMNKLKYLASSDKEAYEKALADKQEETVEAVVDQYMARQKYLKQQRLDPLEELFERDPTVHLSYNGIRDEESLSFSYDHMGLSEKEVRKEMNRQYEAWAEERLRDYETSRTDYVDWLAENPSLGYYVRSVSGTVYTNLDKKPSMDFLQSHNIYAVKDGKHDVAAGLDYLKRARRDSPLDDAPEGSAICFFLPDDLKERAAEYSVSGLIAQPEDEYLTTRQLYDVQKERPAGFILAVMIFSYLLGLALLVWFLHLAGHVNTEHGVEKKIAFIDRLPGDVHTLLSGILFGVALGIPLEAMVKSSDQYSFWRWLPLGGALVTALCLLILAEWLASVCRTVKSGHGFWKHTLIGRLVGWVGKNGKFIVANWKEAAANARYAPKQLPKRAVFWVLGYLLLNMFLINLMVHLAGPVDILFLCLFIAFNTYVLARLVRYLRGLDEIIEASGNDTDFKVNERGLPASLRTLAGNLTVTKETMDRAVEKAVQEERTRTELITNVTHDLKTPLTSLINYSDLLRRKAETAELGDEESVKYVDVIHDQSEKLKVLIDDLLEASKASAGNIPLNRTVLNLTELAAQAIAEFSEDMEKNGNEVVFLDGSGGAAAKEHLVFADGTETYRILSNLLSNAQKYSAPNTRIYATVSDGSASTVFELKNTSAAPLNITAEELMERFVRGDRSRSETEGNGLGLSIARDLASLMGGKLVLDIDGDLFKATLSLPAAILPEKPAAPPEPADAE